MASPATSVGVYVETGSAYDEISGTAHVMQQRKAAPPLPSPSPSPAAAAAPACTDTAGWDNQWINQG